MSTPEEGNEAAAGGGGGEGGADVPPGSPRARFKDPVDGGDGGEAEGGGVRAASRQALFASGKDGPNTRSATRMEQRRDTLAVGVSPTENDLETGAPAGEGGVVREQHVQVRHNSQAHAMGRMGRARMRLQGMARSMKNNALEDTIGAEEAAAHPQKQHESGVGAGAQADDSADSDVQYRLVSKARQKGARGFAEFLCKSDVGDENTGCCDVNEWIASYLRWTFRISFSVLFLSLVVAFVVLTLVYAGLIMWSGSNRPQCIASAAFIDWESYTNNQRFADAYQLSWTTFSTVGYGLIYPESSAGNPDQKGCIGIKILCSSEAFFGVLFAGFAGAILYGKVSRLQSFAQVVFTDPIVIRFGSGVAGERDDDDDDEEEEDTGDEQWKGDEEEGAQAGGERSKHAHAHFPILEFRIANCLNGTPKGEIMDATLNCIASTDARHACPEILKTVDAPREGGKGWLRRRRKSSLKSSMKRSSDDNGRSSSLHSSAVGGPDGGDPLNNTESTPLSMVTPKSSTGSLTGADSSLGVNPDLALLRKSSHQAMDEGSALAPRRIFSKMDIQTDSHPFFKRVWLARHVLDEHSPVLTNQAKKMIRKNKGHWPEELNSYQAIRDSIRFNQIIVSLSGTCNVNGASVYAQKIYHYVDIIVGYKFATVLFRDRDGMLKVDMDLIDDVQEQDGDDKAEPLKGEAIGEY
eukprot:CAMPEP_0197442998 /NCGR_PEP_ID=MMETSP1175-20131217/8874_1 /TAXON_ID=1003142 /ORGANISM="Triceratium dubium, Strain CCMP147" /LENGTH=692 /DNA_ID=CAMNT_0042973575 /DNA_START=83 /DNA_END=2161 /DNA_ORIENTATION=-